MGPGLCLWGAQSNVARNMIILCKGCPGRPEEGLLFQSWCGVQEGFLKAASAGTPPNLRGAGRTKSCCPQELCWGTTPFPTAESSLLPTSFGRRKAQAGSGHVRRGFAHLLIQVDPSPCCPGIARAEPRKSREPGSAGTGPPAGTPAEQCRSAAEWRRGVACWAARASAPSRLWMARGRG